MASCSQGSTQDEKAFVLTERLRLRSSTAQAARVVGELKSGDQVTVTDRANAEDGEDWAKVKGPNGESGWIKSVNLVKREIVEKSRQIAAEIKDIPTQAVGKSKAPLKLRLSPDRSDDENVATTLPSGTRLEIVARERKPRPARIEGKGEAKEEPESNVRYDNWYEVRLKDYAVLPAGWIYGDSVELEIPGEIFYFVSSGRRNHRLAEDRNRDRRRQRIGRPFPGARTQEFRRRRWSGFRPRQSAGLRPRDARLLTRPSAKTSRDDSPSP